MKIVYVVNNCAFFCSHRLPVALSAQKAGHEVLLVTGQAGSLTLEAEALKLLATVNIIHVATSFRSGGQNFLAELWGFFELVLVLYRLRPDIVHCASPKGLLYGGLAARIIRCQSLVLAVSGMGSLFTGQSYGLQAWIRRFYLVLAKIVYKHSNLRVIVQNPDDRSFLVHAGFVAASDIELIPGSGVILDKYIDLPINGRDSLVVLAARLLKDKGVEEFAEAARAIRASGCCWRFALVGTADYDNPSAIPEHRVRAWVDEDVLEWWGHCDNMREVYAKASIVCLPSYREGMPKVLLEAAASGCAIVTTDAIGCRDAILPGKSGDLVPVADSQALTKALLDLIDDPARIKSYGRAGRQLAIDKFDLDAVVKKTMSIYDHLYGRSH